MIGKGVMRQSYSYRRFKTPSPDVVAGWACGAARMRPYTRGDRPETAEGCIDSLTEPSPRSTLCRRAVEDGARQVDVDVQVVVVIVAIDERDAGKP